MSASETRPDWSARVAALAVALVVCAAGVLAVTWRPSASPAAEPGFPYAIVAERHAGETDLHQVFVAVDAGHSRDDIRRLAAFLSERFARFPVLMLHFYDDEATARAQSRLDYDPPADWDRHVVGQFIRNDRINRRWIGRPGRHGSENW
jgi:hypothetical protein